MKTRTLNYRHHSIGYMPLGVTFFSMLFMLWGCGGKPASDSHSSTGSLSFQLTWDDASVSGHTHRSITDCGALDVQTVQLFVYGSDQVVLAQGAPWNCESRTGRLTNISPASACTAVIVAANPAGVANFRAVVSNVDISADQETQLGLVSMDTFDLRADAGSDQHVLIGEEIELNADASTCAPPAPLTYQWFLTSAPQGSASVLSSPNAIAPHFTPDLGGRYIFSLIVSDAYSVSLADEVIILAEVENGMPVAHAGEDQQVGLGQSIDLDGSASSDPENSPLSYSWAVLNRPDGSTAELNPAADASPSFLPDLIGDYSLELTVNDGKADSLPDNVVISAVNTPPQSIISSPQDASIGYLCDPIVLVGSATDNQDGEISGNGLKWTSNRDGDLGIGLELRLDNLSLGAHTISLTGTDAHGAKDQVSIELQVYYQRVVDTGQTQSFTETSGEDSDYLINPFAYTDNGDGTISDLHTGLMWEQTAGISGGYTITEAESHCENLDVAGHTDWRMPNRKELISVISYWNLSPAINKTYFNTYSLGYFSSERCEDWGGRAIVDFDYGNIRCDANFDNHQVRCVRGGITQPYPWTEGLVDNGNGTVLDLLTGLVWQQEEYAQTPPQGTRCEDINIDSLTWESALTYCQELELGGEGDWRLPSLKELESITDERGYQTCYNMTYFPHACGDYWSSTSFIVDSGHAYYYQNRISDIRFKDKLSPGNVKCVRGGLE